MELYRENEDFSLFFTGLSHKTLSDEIGAEAVQTYVRTYVRALARLFMGE